MCFDNQWALTCCPVIRSRRYRVSLVNQAEYPTWERSWDRKSAQRIFFSKIICLVSYLGGETGIRTLGPRKGTTVFETAPIDHSGTSPLGVSIISCEWGCKWKFQVACCVLAILSYRYPCNRVSVFLRARESVWRPRHGFNMLGSTE